MGALENNQPVDFPVTVYAVACLYEYPGTPRVRVLQEMFAVSGRYPLSTAEASARGWAACDAALRAFGEDPDKLTRHPHATQVRSCTFGPPDPKKG